MSTLALRRFRILSIALLAACELQPAPKQHAAPPPAPAPVAPPAPAVVVDAGVDAPPQLQASEQCKAVGVHIATVIINSATDPGQKSIYEQDREKIARAAAEACTTQGWSDTANKCFLGAKTAPELKKCEDKHLSPPTPRPLTGAGGGSAAQPGAGSGSAAPAGAGSGAGGGAPARNVREPRPARAGAGSAAQPARPGAGSAAQPARPGAGSAAQPARPTAGSAAPRP